MTNQLTRPQHQRAAGDFGSSAQADYERAEWIKAVRSRLDGLAGAVTEAERHLSDMKFVRDIAESKLLKAASDLADAQRDLERRLDMLSNTINQCRAQGVPMSFDEHEIPLRRNQR